MSSLHYKESEFDTNRSASGQQIKFMPVSLIKPAEECIVKSSRYYTVNKEMHALAKN
jgi:hypothetical protein